MKPMQQPTTREEYLSGDELASRIRITPQTLTRWRFEGKGPDYLKVGGRIVYRWSDVEGWLARRKVECEYR